MKKLMYSRLALSLFSLILLAGAIILPFALTPKHTKAASSSSADVLILDSTVSGGSSSLEAQTALSLGLTVNVVDTSTWSSMTTADFASYKEIVLGDPTCSGDPSVLQPAVDNASVWGAAITGNVVIIGTDPVFHASEQVGATQLITNGIKYASSVGTGAYIDLSCYYAEASSDTPVPVLSGLGSSGFTLEGQGGCPNNSHIVGDSDVVSNMSDDLLSNWGCSTHEAFDSWPSDYSVQVITKDIPSSYTAPDGTSGAPYILTHTAKKQLFLFVQGIDSGISSTDASSNTIPTSSFGQPGGIYGYLKNRYPQATFRMFSYNGANSSGTPFGYSCQDTFSQHLSGYVKLLKDQITTLLNKNPGTDLYLIGHSMGGAVILGLLAYERINGYINVNGGKIAGAVTLDSPLGGVQNVLHIASYFSKKYYISSCPAIQTQQLSTNSLSDLFSIFGTASALPHGAFNSIAMTLYGADFTNEEVVEGASTFAPVMTVGNLRDWIYDPQACLPLTPGVTDFASTEWAVDAGNNSGIYARVFSDGVSTCPGITKSAVNHGLVFTEPSVQTAIGQLVDGVTPTALQVAPTGP